MRFEHRAIDTLINSSFLSTEEGGGGLSYLFKDMANRPKIETVSYTHLTLPTICSV